MLMRLIIDQDTWLIMDTESLPAAALQARAQAATDDHPCQAALKPLAPVGRVLTHEVLFKGLDAQNEPQLKAARHKLLVPAKLDQVESLTGVGLIERQGVTSYIAYLVPLSALRRR